MSKKLQVRREFVQEAYNVADYNWKDRINKEFPKLFKLIILEELGGMALDCYKLNRKDYTDFSIGEHITILPAYDVDFYVAVRLPGANKRWSLSAFAFIRHFIEYMEAKEISAFPWHSTKDVKEVSDKLGWSLSGCLLIYVQNRTTSVLAVDGKELLETSEEFVREAHKAACKDWKKKIEHELIELFEDEKTYSIGTRVMINSPLLGNEEYILTSIQDKSYLICIRDGKPWNSENYMNIVDNQVTHSQLKKYVSCPFNIITWYNRQIN